MLDQEEYSESSITSSDMTQESRMSDSTVTSADSRQVIANAPHHGDLEQMFTSSCPHAE